MLGPAIGTHSTHPLDSDTRRQGASGRRRGAALNPMPESHAGVSFFGSSYFAERSVTAFRLVQWAILLALVWKLGAFIQMLKVYLALPLQQSFFPGWLQSPYSVTTAYLVTLAALAVAALSDTRRLRFIGAIVSLLAITVLCIHQGSYNDMTFATAWWASVWSVWLATRLGVEDDSRLIRKAAFASRCIASMVLLGGAVGKWTDEYWSGQALYEIYYQHRDFWFFNCSDRCWMQRHCESQRLGIREW